MILSDRLSDKHVLLSDYGLNYIREDGTWTKALNYPCTASTALKTICASEILSPSAFFVFLCEHFTVLRMVCFVFFLCRIEATLLPSNFSIRSQYTLTLICCDIFSCTMQGLESVAIMHCHVGKVRMPEALSQSQHCVCPSHAPTSHTSRTLRFTFCHWFSFQMTVLSVFPG